MRDEDEDVLTYAHVCSRMLAYADVCAAEQPYPMLDEDDQSRLGRETVKQ
jgi:hypothetical protein